MDRWTETGYLYAVAKNAMEKHNHFGQGCCAEAVVDGLINARACGDVVKIAEQAGEIRTLREQNDDLKARLSNVVSQPGRRQTVENIVMLVMLCIAIGVLIFAVADLGPFGPR